MYTLYYINQSYQINTIQVQTLDEPVVLPEDLHFIALRQGISFLNEPSECISFTDLERLAIAGRLDDITIFQNHSFRLKNSKFTAVCQVDQQIITPPNTSPWWTLKSYNIEGQFVCITIQADKDFTDLTTLSFKGHSSPNAVELEIRSQVHPIKSIDTVNNTVTFLAHLGYMTRPYYYIMHEYNVIRSDNWTITLPPVVVDQSDNIIITDVGTSDIPSKVKIWFKTKLTSDKLQSVVLDESGKYLMHVNTDNTPPVFDGEFYNYSRYFSLSANSGSYQFFDVNLDGQKVAFSKLFWPNW